ncbi:MAG: amidohydrolase family protein [Deltaproteobacteria bacterium]|nr:amidohydrolase family protein [Deltaproteobacteria bacterium]
MDCPPPHPHPVPAVFTPPPGAWDCHAHVFGPASRFPLVPNPLFNPPDALPATYLRMLDTLGLTRGVLVQSSVHGTDNSALLAALTEYKTRLRGVVVIDPALPDRELERLHSLGVRGVRFNAMAGEALLNGMEAMARRIAPLGWHIQTYAPLPLLAKHAGRFAALPVPLVIDHLAQVGEGTPLEHPDFLTVLALVRQGAWVKLSAPYRLSMAPPPYGMTSQYARAFIAAAPDRCVWASDWPHPGYSAQPMPNDGSLLSLLMEWAGDTVLRNRILVENPSRLYGGE